MQNLVIYILLFPPFIFYKILYKLRHHLYVLVMWIFKL